MTYLISSLAPGLAARVAELRDEIKAGGTATRTIADLEAELEIKRDLLGRMLASAVPVRRVRRSK